MDCWPQPAAGRAHRDRRLQDNSFGSRPIHLAGWAKAADSTAGGVSGVEQGPGIMTSGACFLGGSPLNGAMVSRVVNIMAALGLTARA